MVLKPGAESLAVRATDAEFIRSSFACECPHCQWGDMSNPRAGNLGGRVLSAFSGSSGSGVIRRIVDLEPVIPKPFNDE